MSFRTNNKADRISKTITMTNGMKFQSKLMSGKVESNRILKRELATFYPDKHKPG